MLGSQISAGIIVPAHHPQVQDRLFSHCFVLSPRLDWLIVLLSNDHEG